MAVSANNHFDFIVVGAGVVGTALALGIAGQARSAARVALVEADEFPRPWSPPVAHKAVDYEPRVNTLNTSTVALLRDLEVWDSITKERCCAFKRLRVWDDGGAAELCFDAAQMGSEQLGYVVEGGLLAHVLSTALMNLANAHKTARIRLFTMCHPTSLHQDARGVRMELNNGEVLSASYVFAADGTHSSLRSLAHLRWYPHDCQQTAIVCALSHEKAHAHTAWQRFLVSGPLAFLPLCGPELARGRDQHLSSVVWSLDNPVAQEVLALKEPQFRARLNKAFGKRLGELGVSTPRRTFPLRYGTVRNYVHGRVVLVGDAAHTVHPMAGLGANMGLGDVAVLLRALRTFDGERLSLGEYRARRYLYNTGTMFGMEALRRLLSARTPSLRWLRNIGTEHIARSAGLKQFFMRWAS